LKASVGAGEEEVHTWCESTFKYTEYPDPETGKDTDYLLRLHKNGTMLITTNELDEGVSAKWKFTYYTEDDDEVSYTASPTCVTVHATHVGIRSPTNKH
jgi:hypothetical protein